jgi:hypothetical protein
MLTSREVQKILNDHDWQEYDAKVSWSINMPRCPFYEGAVICPYWIKWIRIGRELYDKFKKTRDEFVEDLKENMGGRFKLEEILSIIDEKLICRKAE